MTTLPVPVQIQGPEPATGRTLAAAAALTRSIADSLLASVQRTTELNWHASRLLLARHCAAQWHECAENNALAWRWSWRSYQVCATTAAQVLELVRQHAQSGSEDMWRTLRTAAAELPGIDGRRVVELQASLRAIETACDAYLDSVAQLQRDLIALAREESE